MRASLHASSFTAAYCKCRGEALSLSVEVPDVAQEPTSAYAGASAAFPASSRNLSTWLIDSYRHCTWHRSFTRPSEKMGWALCFKMSVKTNMCYICKENVVCITSRLLSSEKENVDLMCVWAALIPVYPLDVFCEVLRTGLSKALCVLGFWWHAAVVSKLWDFRLACVVLTGHWVEE